nr:uncharacterized protein LOC109147065 [Ipomoea trifida]
MNGVLQMEAYPNPGYLKDHVEDKLKCVIQELDDVIYFKLRNTGSMKGVEEDISDPLKWLRRHESSSDSKFGLMQKNEIGVSTWLSGIAKRMEKIRIEPADITHDCLSQEELRPSSYQFEALLALPCRIS